ncbi:TSC22 domain family protein 3 [Crotalus adamanteus]|uniref:TSC22 domain family protein 3 n=1 Tax=Crotalus adamanteus TaxID=8729 RepID=A0AAW1AVJ8_CROAD
MTEQRRDRARGARQRAIAAGSGRRTPDFLPTPRTPELHVGERSNWESRLPRAVSPGRPSAALRPGLANKGFAAVRKQAHLRAARPGPAGVGGARASSPPPPASPAPAPSCCGGAAPETDLVSAEGAREGDGRSSAHESGSAPKEGAGWEAKGGNEGGCWPNSPVRKAKLRATAAVTETDTAASGLTACPRAPAKGASHQPPEPPLRAASFGLLAGTGMSSSPLKERLSPVGLDCCSCCLDLANGPLGYNSNFTPLLQLREQLACESLGAAPELRRLMRQDSLEPVVRDPRYLLSRGMCNRNIDQTLLSILLFFHRWARAAGRLPMREFPVKRPCAGVPVNSELGVLPRPPSTGEASKQLETEPASKWFTLQLQGVLAPRQAEEESRCFSRKATSPSHLSGAAVSSCHCLNPEQHSPLLPEGTNERCLPRGFCPEENSVHIAKHRPWFVNLPPQALVVPAGKTNLRGAALMEKGAGKDTIVPISREAVSERTSFWRLTEPGGALSSYGERREGPREERPPEVPLTRSESRCLAHLWPHQPRNLPPSPQREGGIG